MRTTLALFVVLSMAAPAVAQSEWTLKEYFEGRVVRARIDMPATNNGIDLDVDERQKIDFGKYQREVKTNGVAVKAGDTIMVTKVKVKGRHIEFQLGGGGFGTLLDDDWGWVSGTSSSKTQREKDLERDLKTERDAEARRRMTQELDTLKKDRQREDERNRVAADQATEVSKMRIWEQRGQGGSRFNLRFRGDVPRDITPDTVVAMLAPYLEFTDAGVITTSVSSDRLERRPRAAVEDAPSLPAGKSPTSLTEGLRKGLTRDEVDRLAGPPTQISERHDAGLSIVRAVYVRNDHRVDAEFVEGVLVRYTLSVK